MSNIIARKLRSFIVSLAYGMKNTEEDILHQKTSSLSASNSCEQKVQQNQLAQDLLKGVVTTEVEMLRDRTYYVSEESKKYNVIIDTVGTTKAVKNMAAQKIPQVYNGEEGYNVSIVMDNNAVPSGVIDGLKAVGSFGIKDIYPLNFSYEYIPKFQLEQYVNKLVIRSGKNSLHMDLYVPIYTDSFERLEKIFDNEINKVNKRLSRPTNLEFDEVNFISDKTYGADDLCKFNFKMLKFLGISEYDGKNILSYEVKQTETSTKITDKYINKKLRDDYANNAPRKTTLDLTGEVKKNHNCDKCGNEVENEYDYRISKETIGIGLCKKCLEKYNKENDPNV
jgi:hypothetical protein